MFSVAVTDASSRSIRAPLSEPRSESDFLPASAFAPSARKPAKWVSRRRWPIGSPPGGGSEARPRRARSGPAKRKEVRIFAASSGAMRAVRMRGAEIVAVPAARSREIFAPNERAASSIIATSSISGTFSSVTGSGESSAAAIIGSAAFLLPCTRWTPETVRRPLMTSLAIVSRASRSTWSLRRR